MKKIFLISLSILLIQNLNAQTIDTSTYDKKMDFIFQHIDKSQITTGLLSEYGIDFMKLNNFTGSSLNDSNYTSLSDWRMLYGSIYSMQLQQNSAVPALAGINTQVDQLNTQTNTISFVGLYYKYNSINANASSLFYASNGQLYDVVGRTQNPYDNNELFAFAPTVQTIVAGTTSFLFNNSNIYSNTTATIAQIDVDAFGNGNYQTVGLGTPLSVDYSTAATYNVVVKVTYSGGTIKYAHTKIIVLAQTNTSNSNTAAKFGSRPINHLDITASKQYLGIAAQGDITVDFAKNNTTRQIKKPLIVVNGFDPVAKDRNTGTSYLADIVPNMDNDLNSGAVIPLNGTNGLDDLDHYDLIFVHWWNGTDYIQRNAYLLESVIQWVNANKVSNNGVIEQNVITGFSMGGLVVRYALRDMELNSLNHNCRLFISHDALLIVAS